MIGHFGSFVSRQASNFVADPWVAINVLDDVPGIQQNARLLSPLIAYQAGKSDRGEKLAELAAGGAGLATLPIMAGASMSMLGLVAPSLGGPVAWVAMVLGTALLTNGPNAWLRKSVFRSVRTLQQFGRKTRHLEMGGYYRDTETSQAWRMSSLREMSGSHQAARTYLGREAAFMQ